jgi:outer membrane protein assembly factor BamB
MRRRALVVLTTAACLVLGSCDWSQYRYGPGHTGYNPVETAITPANVSQLQPAWSGPQLGVPHDPLVAEGSVFVAYADDTRPSALSALNPHSGSVRWSLIYPSSIGGFGTPAFAGGLLYVPVWTTGSAGTLNAYRAGDGTLVWSSPSAGPSGAPAVVGDMVYQGFSVLDSGGFSHGWQARDAANGNVRFGARASGVGLPSVAVADGILYAGAGAYDAAGVVNCSGGPPKTCSPLWSYTIAGSTPAVSDGIVYLTTDSGKVAAFPAKGCGLPTCAPLWKGTAGSLSVSPAAVAGGTVFVSAQDGALYAFRASGCGAPTCSPLWIGLMQGGGASSPPSVANGLVFAGSLDDRLHAFSARGCVGAVCQPLWTAPLTGEPLTTPVVANGSVLVGTTDRRLHAYRLPAL